VKRLQGDWPLARRAAAPHGSVLIVTLFVLAVTGLIALSLSYRAALIVRMARHRELAVRLRARLDSALAASLAVLAEDRNDFDHPAEPWGSLAGPALDAWLSVRTAPAENDSAEYEVLLKIQDEEGKLNLQHASSAALESLGLSPMQIDSLFDWTDGDSLVRPAGAESEFYGARPRPYRSKDKPLHSLEELLLVRGFTLADLPGSCLPGPSDVPQAETTCPTRCLTVFGDGKINLNTAPAAVLRTTPLSASAIQSVLAYRAYNETSSAPLADCVFRSNEDIEQLQGLSPSDRQVLQQISTFTSRHFRLQVVCRHVRSGLQSSLNALILKDADENPRVLQWQLQP